MKKSVLKRVLCLLAVCCQILTFTVTVKPKTGIKPGDGKVFPTYIEPPEKDFD